MRSLQAGVRVEEEVGARLGAREVLLKEVRGGSETDGSRVGGRTIPKTFCSGLVKSSR